MNRAKPARIRHLGSIRERVRPRRRVKLRQADTILRASFG
jgi:hypothetical protein